MKQRKTNKTADTLDPSSKEYEVPGEYFRFVAEDGKAIQVKAVASVTADKDSKVHASTHYT